MTTYGITANYHRLAAFLANVMHETGGLTIGRESLNYRTPARLKQVWPKRFGAKSDAELMALCGNEQALACAVYDGRMGNRPGTTDAYDYRGGGFLQMTGRDDWLKYCKLAGVDIEADPSKTDDTNVSLICAAAEWHHAHCNELVDAGNFDGACAAINVGNPAGVARCVGLVDRIKWHHKCLQMFALHPEADDPPAALTEGMNPDGDTPPGQQEHWSDNEDVA